MQRQFHDERRALAFFALYMDLATVQHHQLMHNGQSQARAAGFALSTR